MFKIVNGYEDVDRNMFFKLKEGSRTRGHKAALIKEQCRLDVRKYSFSQRVINEWNKLPNDCVNASSVNMFKNRIDRYPMVSLSTCHLELVVWDGNLVMNLVKSIFNLTM